MNAAMEKARKSVDTFTAALKAPKAGQTGFAIKKKFSDGTHVEHMWLQPVTYDGKVFEGEVNNVPADIKGVALGQKVRVAPEEISDWMYLEHGKLVGGYTIRVLREKMSAREREDFDRQARMIID
jgi:uncharacterized protein YegJ (DUF2314 family)